MKKFIFILIFLAAIGGGVFWYLDKKVQDTDTTPTPVDKSDLIQVVVPKPNAAISSPLVISGKARGTWYFEASFPIRLLDANGKEIAVAIAQAQDDPANPDGVNWMTTEFVPFLATLNFSPTTPTGTLVFQKDNPSGLPEHDDELRVPVSLQAVSGPTQSVKLYYYNPQLDKDASGNILCSAKGLQALDRQIPVTTTPAKDVITLLLKGDLTAVDKARGITTEFPLAGVELRSASISNSVLLLTFVDPLNKTSGGSCRVSVLRAQIEATGKQFSTVKVVRIMPNELFQP